MQYLVTMCATLGVVAQAASLVMQHKRMKNIPAALIAQSAATGLWIVAFLLKSFH